MPWGPVSINWLHKTNIKSSLGSTLKIHFPPCLSFPQALVFPIGADNANYYRQETDVCQAQSVNWGSNNDGKRLGAGGIAQKTG